MEDPGQLGWFLWLRVYHRSQSSQGWTGTGSTPRLRHMAPGRMVHWLQSSSCPQAPNYLLISKGELTAAAGFSRRCGREIEREHRSLCSWTCSWKWHHCSSLFFRSKSLKEGIAQGRQFQEAGILGSHVGAAYHTASSYKKLLSVC